MTCDLTNLSDQPRAYYDNVREDMLKYIPAGVRTTLEFGCGFGGFSALLKERFGTESWAVEKEEAAAEQAARTLDRVISGDAVACLAELPDSYFDCIMCFDILEHLPDPYSLLCSIKAKLAEGGILVASIPNIRYYRALVDLVMHGNWDYRDHGPLDKTHLRFFTYKSIVKTFRQLGFEILKLEGIHPTSSRTYKVLNALLLGLLFDVRYKHFAVVARPKTDG